MSKKLEKYILIATFGGKTCLEFHANERNAMRTSKGAIKMRVAAQNKQCTLFIVTIHSNCLKYYG